MVAGDSNYAYQEDSPSGIPSTMRSIPGKESSTPTVIPSVSTLRRVLDIPNRRTHADEVDYLITYEIGMILSACDLDHPTGRAQPFFSRNIKVRLVAHLTDAEQA